MMLRGRIPLTDESGQTMAEYGVVLAVIVLTVIIALGVMSGAIATSIGDAADLDQEPVSAIKTASPACAGDAALLSKEHTRS